MLTVRKNDATILEQLREAGILLESPCNGQGICGKCKIKILHGSVSPVTEQESAFLTESEQKQGVRLACFARPLGPVELDPLHLVEETDGHVLGGGDTPPISHLPAVTAEPASPDLAAPKGGRALCTALPSLLEELETPPLQVLRRLPALLKAPELWAVRYCGYLADLREDNKRYGLAVDIGTTTVAVSLMDLATGQCVGEDGFLNPQKAFGLDVLSRIHYDATCPDGVLAMQDSIAQRLGQSARDLAGAISTGTADIYEVVVSGNATMLHVFLGIPLATLGRAPYSSVFTHSVTVKAADLGLHLNEEAMVYCLPFVSTYIGGDIVAGALAARLDEAADTALLIDIGTNGEMVLCRCGRMHACSCAAGPALEGMNISCGMRAEPGAVERVYLTEDRVELDTIGNIPPRGLCGSGLLEAISQGLRHGVIAKNGRIAQDHPLTETDERGKRRIVLDRAHGLFITQEDVRQVQLCKGAILSGILTLLDRLDLKPEEINRVLVAGQFGRHLNPESLAGAGLIPAALAGRISYLGNTSQTGARMCLLSMPERRRAEALAKGIDYIELSTSPGYERLFTRCLQFGTV